MKRLLTPKYLTEEVAQRAVNHALSSAFVSFSELMKRRHCHIVVLVQAMEDAREAEYPNWPNYPTEAYALYQRSVAKEDWEHPYDKIAMCKALQLWTDRNTDGRTSSVPHLLFPSDTPWWGGAKREGIVVACSGVQPHFDQMISNLTIDVMVALAHDAYENDDERKKPGTDFLT